MEKMKLVDRGWGSFFKFKIQTDVRPFDQVDSALRESGIADHHSSVLIERPKASTAFTRSMGYLTRVCASNIPFPAGSPNAEWEENGHKVGGERNPNYSLKIETVKAVNTDGSVAYRINISDRRLAVGNMSHVLTAVYRPDQPVGVVPGSDTVAWEKYGKDLSRLVNDAYFKFFNNYDDSDVRAVVDRELALLKAVNVLGKTTNFIARDTEKAPHNSDRATKLVKFIRDAGHEATLLGLDGTAPTRDAIVDELKSSILAELDEYEEELDYKLNAKTKVRKRGEKQRTRMQNTALQNIDGIYALAEYHIDVLGVVSDEIRNRVAKLKEKAGEYLTRDFGSGATPSAKVNTEAMTDMQKRIAQLEAENARLKGFQGVQGIEHAPAPATVDAPFANIS